MSFSDAEQVCLQVSGKSCRRQWRKTQVGNSNVLATDGCGLSNYQTRPDYISDPIRSDLTESDPISSDQLWSDQIRLPLQWWSDWS